MFKLDEKCDEMQNTIFKMVKRIVQMQQLSIECLKDGDADKALKVIDLDNYVNTYEVEINDLAIESLALLQPVAKDLRRVIASIKIASDLERIADYSKNLAAYVLKFGPFDEEMVEIASEMSDSFLVMLDHTMDAYNKKDANMAMLIPEESTDISLKFKELINVIEKRILEDKSDVGKLIRTVSVLRNLERASAHTKNICEHVIFEIKGQHVEFN